MEPLFWPSSGQIPIRNLRRQLKHGQLFWREVGRGQTVIFLHGSWSDGDQWGEILSILGQNYHCLAPDLIGFGESERLVDKKAYSIAMQVDAIDELCSSLRLGPIYLVGHSVGAWVAIRYALQRPEQVKKLCVFEPEGIAYAPKRWRRERWLASPLAGFWLAITKPFVRKSEPGHKSLWLQNAYLRKLLKRHPAACQLLFQRRRNALEAETVGGQLTHLLMPTAAIQGEMAGKNSQQLTQAFNRAAPNSMVKTLPGSDELPSYKAKAVAEFLQDWLS